MADRLSVVVDGIETIGLHNGLYRIRFYSLDAKGQATPAVELVAGSDTVQQIQAGLAQIRTGGSSPAPAAPGPAAAAPARPGASPGSRDAGRPEPDAWSRTPRA